jgi:hypothetical protein
MDLYIELLTGFIKPLRYIVLLLSIAVLLGIFYIIWELYFYYIGFKSTKLVTIRKKIKPIGDLCIVFMVVVIFVFGLMNNLFFEKSVLLLTKYINLNQSTQVSFSSVKGNILKGKFVFEGVAINESSKSGIDIRLGKMELKIKHLLIKPFIINELKIKHVQGKISRKYYLIENSQVSNIYKSNVELDNGLVIKSLKISDIDLNVINTNKLAIFKPKKKVKRIAEPRNESDIFQNYEVRERK